MYWPIRVNWKDCSPKQSSGKSKKGKNVPNKWIKVKVKFHFFIIPKQKEMPIINSQIAKRIKASLPVKKWKDNFSMVFIAKSSAGLKLGKNFKPPNHK